MNEPKYLKENKDELLLPIIPHQIDGSLIEQRAVDGYINATELCKACEKQLKHYLENKSTKEFLNELSSVVGIPTTELIQKIQGGIPQLQGTWVHPDVAINLAQWASPKFAVFVSKWVREWLSGNLTNKDNLPYHIKRYLINRTSIPVTHFSVFNEIIFNLVAPLEDMGYELPDRLVPDISQGKMFAKWTREEKNLEPNDFPTYTHTYPDGRKVPNVKLYPNELLADFRKHFNEVWMIKRCLKYFSDRDESSIPHIKQLIQSLPEYKENKKIN